MEVKVAARCFQCGQWFHPRDLEDESYRIIGDTEKLVEVWACRSCLDEWYEEYDERLFSEVLVYHDDEALYFELRGKDSGVVRLSYEMIDTLKEVIEDEQTSEEVGSS